MQRVVTMTMMSKRAQQSQVRREAVLQATASLLDEVGVAALTVRQVAQRAGVAPGSVFLYADSKSDLVNQVYGLRVAASWHELLDRLRGEPPLDRVEKFYLGCVDIFYSDLDNVLAFYREMGSHIGNRLSSVDGLRTRVRHVLDEAAAAGQLRPGVQVEILDYSYQGVYSNVIRLAAEGLNVDEARRIVAGSMDQLRRGVESS